MTQGPEPRGAGSVEKLGKARKQTWEGGQGVWFSRGTLRTRNSNLLAFLFVKVYLSRQRTPHTEWFARLIS